MPDTSPFTRLAPSPTGALHLGNARTFLITWAWARRNHARIVLRVEDLDGPRVKPEAINLTIDLLAWLGIDWDVGPIVQSQDLAPYREAMRSLADRGLAYPCQLTRAEIEAAASAPQDGVHEPCFPESLRPPIRAREFDDEGTNWRLVVDPGVVEFDDLFAGPQSLDPSRTVGDFVLWTKRGQPSYQLAVVVDDHRQGITHVIRGNDLLDSAARQRRITRALGLVPEPAFMHIPLVLGHDGKRLAKRHGDTRLDAYRALGVPASRVLALIARWCGMDRQGAISVREFADGLDLTTIPRGPITFTEEDHRWLLAGANA